MPFKQPLTYFNDCIIKSVATNVMPVSFGIFYLPPKPLKKKPDTQPQCLEMECQIG